MSTHLTLENVRKSFHTQEVLKGIDLFIQKGEFIAIIGKSGSGKSTLLRLMAGLDTCCEGMIQMNHKPLYQLNERARIMFQDGRLLPWKRIFENVCLGLPKDERMKAQEALQHVGLEGRMNDWPSQLSGGQKQRVALARALVHEPELLLLDEPLGALDALTRLDMQDLIESLWMQKKFTAILVTHDVEEAVTLADRVMLIKHGVVHFSQPIELTRPRQRTHPKFSLYVESLLDRIMDRKSNEYTSVLKHTSSVASS